MLSLCSIRNIFNKAGYTATEVACGWAGATVDLTRSFGAVRPITAKTQKN